MIKLLIAGLILFTTTPSFGVEKKIVETRERPQSTTGQRFQIFQATIYPDFDLLFLIDNQTGRTWRYVSGENGRGWVEQGFYEQTKNEEESSMSEEFEKIGQQRK